MRKKMRPLNLDPLWFRPGEIRHYAQVKAPDIFEGSTQNFHEEGLFSTTIFGNVGTEPRDNTFGYIDIKLDILHPYMLETLIDLRGFYKEIITGKGYALWSVENKDFEPSNAVDGKTGFQFFLQHWKEIEFKPTRSKLRDERIEFYNKFKDVAETNKILVYPAGLRDVSVDELGRVKKDEVNDHYLALIAISNAISDDISRANSSALDMTRLSLQNAFTRVYDHFFSIIEGKGGSIQKQLASRNVYYGTRNVITPYAAPIRNNNSIHAPNPDNVIIGLYQLMSGSLPFVQNWMLQTWSNKVFSTLDGSATLINPETLKPEYVRCPPQVIDRWTTSSGIEELVHGFQHPKLRNKPVKIEGRYLALIYQDEHYFKIMRSIDELPMDGEFDAKNVHPLTYIEMFYLAGYREWNKSVLFNTRYPIEGNGSIFPTLAYLRTTLRDFQLYELGEDWKFIDEDHLALSYPNIQSSNYFDAMSVHPKQLAASGADHDGDMFSATPVFTDESIKEALGKLNDPTYYINPRGGFMYSAMTDIVERVIRNITK